MIAYHLLSYVPGCSTPKQYNEAADFTLSAKKRKRNGTEEGEGVEPAGEEEQQGEKTPVAKKRKRSAVQEDTAGQEEGEEEVKTPVTKKHKKEKKIKKERDFDFSAEGDGIAAMETPGATDGVEMEVNVVAVVIVAAVVVVCACMCVRCEGFCCWEGMFSCLNSGLHNAHWGSGSESTYIHVVVHNWPEYYPLCCSHSPKMLSITLYSACIYMYITI